MTTATGGSRAVTPFAAAQVRWLVQFRAGLQKLRTPSGESLALIPNTCLYGSGMQWSDPLAQQIRDAADGILDEAGWTGWGSQRVPDPEWSNMTFYALDLQEHGKAYYAINECNPAKVGSVETPALREWIVGSYLMSKQAAAAVYISGVQEYGDLMPAWPELAVNIGTPRDARPIHDGAAGVWLRNYSNGIVFVNADQESTANATLAAGRCYKTIAGKAVLGLTVVLPPLSASILVLAPCLQ